MMGKIQKSLYDLQKDEEEEQELAIPAESDSFFSCMQGSQLQLGLTVETSEKGGLSQPSTMISTTIGKAREILPHDQRDLTTESVQSFPVHTDPMKASDSDESIVVEKCDSSPARVRGFAPPHFDAGQNESTMKFKSPKNYNPAFQEPTIRTWLEKMDMYLELSNCPEGQWIGATVMLLEGAAMMWYNGNKQQGKTCVQNGLTTPNFGQNYYKPLSPCLRWNEHEPPSEICDKWDVSLGIFRNSGLEVPNTRHGNSGGFVSLCGGGKPRNPDADRNPRRSQ